MTASPDNPYANLQQTASDMYRVRRDEDGTHTVVNAADKVIFTGTDEADVIRQFRTDPDYGDALALVLDY
jgi:hypothetical protein